MSSTSSSFRSEINIPVKKDPRTFEQSRKDLVTKLEKSYKSSSMTDAGEDAISSVSSQNVKSTTRSSGAGPLTTGSSWEFQRSKWIDDARRKFDEDVRRMRSNMFALEVCLPMDEFDLENWDNFSSLTGGPGGADHGFEAMERRMQALRQQMDSQMRMLGPGGGHPGGHHQMTSHFSSSSTRTVNDGGVVTSNTSTTQESRQTVDGVTTGTKSHSSSSNTNRLGSGVDQQLVESAGAPGAVVPTTPGSPALMDFLSNAYEVGDDGLVHFKIRFDAKDFAPEDIDVTTVGNRLTVHASKSVKTATSTSSREFSRTVDLPRSIDHEKFQCSLTEDGVLVLDAPVKAPDYASITFDSSHNLGIRPKDSSALKSAETQVTVRGQSGPVVLNDGAGGRKLHLEVPIEAGFTANDLCVRMDANKICISGKKERSSDRSTSSGSSSKSSEFAEFSRTFEVPETIDPFTVSAVLKGDTLVIEAPLLCTV
uniref:RPAP1_N domain-containing protein n=1 Tax=Mesocestoides corti TaxID=53468 RepID=A0A5K3EJ41_MESCO